LTTGGIGAGDGIGDGSATTETGEMLAPQALSIKAVAEAISPPLNLLTAGRKAAGSRLEADMASIDE